MKSLSFYYVLNCVFFCHDTKIQVMFIEFSMALLICKLSFLIESWSQKACWIIRHVLLRVVCSASQYNMIHYIIHQYLHLFDTLFKYFWLWECYFPPSPWESGGGGWWRTGGEGGGREGGRGEVWNRLQHNIITIIHLILQLLITKYKPVKPVILSHLAIWYSLYKPVLLIYLLL